MQKICVLKGDVSCLMFCDRLVALEIKHFNLMYKYPAPWMCSVSVKEQDWVRLKIKKYTFTLYKYIYALVCLCVLIGFYVVCLCCVHV